MPTGGKATPLSQGFIGQVVAGLRFAVTGKAPDWFGPGAPLVTSAPPQVAGRQFDYPVASNINYVPRMENPSQAGVTFQQLRSLADSLDILRAVIETRKDQVARLRWVIKAKDQKKGSQSVIDDMTALFSFPDGDNDFHTWLRRLLEDLFVIDAPTLYVKRTKGGKPLAFETVDGATIKRLISEDGRTPAPPEPAYQQILKGLPAVDLTVEDLIYAPRNLRNHMFYGYGPVEQIIVTVNMAIRRALGQLAFFTDGSVPEGVMEVPEGWTADQVGQFQDYWDSLLAGNDQQRRRVRMVPAGAKFQNIKPELLADKFDEWLARIICYVFSVSHQPFASQVNRATASTAHQQSLEEGLAPIMLWIKTLIDRILRRYLGHPELEFSWEEDEEQDPLQQAQVDQILVNSGILTVDEVRDRRGLDPLPKEVMETPQLPLQQPFPPSDAAPPHAGPAPVRPLPAATGGEPAPEKATPKDAEKVAKAARTVRLTMHDMPKHEAAIRKAVKKVLRSQVTKVAAQITAQVGKIDKADKKREDKILQGLDINLDALAAPLGKTLKQVWTEASKDAADGLGDQVPEEMLEVVNEAGVEWAEEHVGQLIKNIDESTREFIRSAVAETLNEGYSTAQLADTLADNYAFSDSRAETIARTETAKALIQGTLETWNKSGVVEKKQWVVGDGCCDECEDVDGQIVDLDDNFSTGDDGPPAHPNCRCALVGILPNEEGEE